jgi:hypothetical protein
MRHRILGLPRSVLIAATLIVGLAVAAAVALGSISDSGTIHGCYANNNGALRVIDPSAGDACKTSETALSWQQQGTPGPTGATGATGATGPAGPSGVPVAEGLINGEVNPPTVVRGHGIVSVTRDNGPPTTTYCVYLDPSIDVDHAFAVGNPTTDDVVLSISPGGCVTPQGDGILINVHSPTGTPTPTSFTLVVFA